MNEFSIGFIFGIGFWHLINSLAILRFHMKAVAVCNSACDLIELCMEEKKGNPEQQLTEGDGS